MINLGSMITAGILFAASATATEEGFAVKYPCARVAWENVETLEYGEGEPMEHGVAEAWLGYLEPFEAKWNVYHFIVPSECKKEK